MLHWVIGGIKGWWLVHLGLHDSINGQFENKPENQDKYALKKDLKNTNCRVARVGVGDNIEKNYRQLINRHFSNYRKIIDMENLNFSIIDKIIDIEKCIKFEPINTYKKL